MQLLLPRRLPDNKRRTSRRSGSVALALLLIPAFAVAQDSAAPEAKPVFEEWVVVVLNGKTCGYGSTITTRIDTPTGPAYLTKHHEEFISLRKKARTKMASTWKVVEDMEGGVLNFDLVDESGASVESSGVRDGNDMVVSSRGQTQRFHLPRLAALGPEVIRRKTLAVPLKAGQSFSSSTRSTPISRRASRRKMER